MKAPAFLLFLGVSGLCAADPQTLCNGRDLTGWTDAAGKPAGEGWKVEEGGVIHRTAKAGDLFTAKEYGDFELSFAWKIAPGGNSGVKYRMQPYPGKGLLGPEYQLLDDSKHPDAKVGPQRQSASLYDLVAPDAAAKQLKAPGEWNESRIVVRGPLFEHWLNGALVVKMTVGSPEWESAHGKSKFKGVTDFARNPKGRIMLQDHGDEVWFRDLKITEL
jgi:hypothetical protein